MIVNLHIDRLVIDGLPIGSHDAPIIKAAVSAELTRLLGEDGLTDDPGRSRFDPLLRSEPIARPARDAGNLGTQIGQAVHGVIGK